MKNTKSFKQYLQYIKENQEDSTIEDEIIDKLGQAGIYSSWNALVERMAKSGQEDNIISLIENFANTQLSNGQTVVEYLKANYERYKAMNGNYDGNLTERCGALDYLFYKFVDPKYVLSGYSLAEVDKGDIYTKLSYGFNKTKWGKLQFEQAFGNVDGVFNYISGPIINGELNEMHLKGSANATYANGVYTVTFSNPEDCDDFYQTYGLEKTSPTTASINYNN